MSISGCMCCGNVGIWKGKRNRGRTDDLSSPPPVPIELLLTAIIQVSSSFVPPLMICEDDLSCRDSKHCAQADNALKLS